MRLGQLARKHDIPVQEIIAFLEEETGEKFHPNVKLFDAIEEKVFNHFDLHPDEPVVEPIADPAIEITPPEEPVVDEPETPEADIASVDGELEISEPAPDPTPVEEASTQNNVEEQTRHNEDEVIQTDKLLELLASEDAPADLEKIKLIKAPKKELSGLKVLGKVELPEPKKKEEKDDQKQTRDNKNKRPQLSEEEREKRRLKAKRKKEANEARKEKLRKEREAQRLKELRAKHYKEKLEKAAVKKTKKPVKQSRQEPEISYQNQSKPEPKTWLGKWWRWMNT